MAVEATPAMRLRGVPCAGETHVSGNSQIVYLLVTDSGDDLGSSDAERWWDEPQHRI